MDTNIAPPFKKWKGTAPSSSSSSSSSPDVGETVCFVCTSSPAQPIGIGDDHHHVYVLDLSADDGIPVGGVPPLKLPTFTIGYSDCVPNLSSICVLGSTLYLFDGFDPTTKIGGKTFYTHEWDPLEVKRLSNYRLRREDLNKIPEMHGYKAMPLSIPTPDKKGILVFSSFFREDKSEFVEEFELYRPDDGCWQRFAGIPVSWRISDFSVGDYTFIDNQNVLLLTTDNIGMFTLDLSSPDQPCRRLPSPMPVPDFGDNPIVLLGDRLFLGPHVACKGQAMTFIYPGLLRASSSRITLLRVDDSECRFCIIQSQTKRANLRAQIIVNVYKLDLGEYRKRMMMMEEEGKQQEFHKKDVGLPQLPATEIVKSFVYDLGTQMFDDSFNPRGLFSTQPTN